MSRKLTITEEDSDSSLSLGLGSSFTPSLLTATATTANGQNDETTCTRRDFFKVSEIYDYIIWKPSSPSREELRHLSSLINVKGQLTLQCPLKPDTFLDCLLVGFSKPEATISENGNTFHTCTKSLNGSSSIPLRKIMLPLSANSLVDEDSLLTEEDKIKPDNSIACGNETKRRACKNCSCGLAEKDSLTNNNITVNTAAVKSSCGNCYLGDAYRCGGCPYKGLPAFKQGEQVEIPSNFLSDDL